MQQKLTQHCKAVILQLKIQGSCICVLQVQGLCFLSGRGRGVNGGCPFTWSIWRADLPVALSFPPFLPGSSGGSGMELFLCLSTLLAVTQSSECFEWMLCSSKLVGEMFISGAFRLQGPGAFWVSTERQQPMLFSRSVVSYSGTPWTAACQAPLSSTISQSLLILMSMDWLSDANHFILCCPLLLSPSIFPSIRVFSMELALCNRWPKDWSFSFIISCSNEYSALLVYWLDFLPVIFSLL